LTTKSASRSPHSVQRSSRAQSGTGVPDEGGRSEHGGHSPRPSSVVAGQDVASATRRRGSSCLPVFGAVLWALAGVTRRPYKFKRPLTIEVLSSTRFLESATSGRGLTQRVTAAV